MEAEEKQSELTWDEVIGYKDGKFTIFSARPSKGMSAISRNILTYLLVSPEAFKEIQNWGLKDST